MFSSEINTLKTIVTFIQVISFDFCSFYDGYEDWFQIVDEMFNNAADARGVWTWTMELMGVVTCTRIQPNCTRIVTRGVGGR